MDRESNQASDRLWAAKVGLLAQRESQPGLDLSMREGLETGRQVENGGCRYDAQFSPSAVGA